MLFPTQPPSQMINLQLHGSSILLIRDVAPASMGGMHTNFSILSSLKIEKMILTLGPIDSSRFGLKPTIIER